MKSLITFALGFIIARQVYINFDKQEARNKEAKLKQKVEDLLEDIGLSKKEAKEQSQQLLKGQ